MLKFVVLLLLVIVVVKATEEKLGFANVRRSGAHGGATIIWDQMKVVKAGTITKWEYYNMGTPVSFSNVAIWRPTEVKNQFQLVGFNKLPGGNSGPATYQVPKPYQIAVKPGDVFGVISFDHSNYANFFSGRWAGYSFKDDNEQAGHILIGRNRATGWRVWTLSELNIGQPITFYEDHPAYRYRVYSIRAIINNSKTVTLC